MASMTLTTTEPAASVLMDEHACDERARHLFERISDILEEDENNIGKMLVIDLESGDYEVDESGLAASTRIEARHPNGTRYGFRVGYQAAVSFAGPLQRRQRA